MRRNGKTTRLIDSAVQRLFEAGKIIVPEEHIGDATKSMLRLKHPEALFFIDPDCQKGNYAQESFRERLVRRLFNEHGEIFEFKKHVIFFKP